MSDPLSFADNTPRWTLPLLFAGQAQKEVFVNEALARLDVLLHTVVEGEASNPPAQPADGEAWIVGATPQAEWSGREDSIASYQGAQWLFVAPSDGMLAFDRATGLRRRYRNGWSAAPAAPQMSGGSTLDAEARTAIAAIVAALSHYGMMSES